MLRAQGHSFSYTHRLQRAWQKDTLTARQHSQCTTPCEAACLQTAEPVGAVPWPGKRPETLIGFRTSLQAVQCFCTVPCNTVDFNADATEPGKEQPGQASAQFSSHITVIMSN